MSTVKFNDITPILRRSTVVALVVGPVLTLINQWEAIAALQTPDLTKVALTFLVPFCVSFFSGYAMRKSVAVQLSASKTLIEELRAEVKNQAALAEAAQHDIAELKAETATRNRPFPAAQASV